MMTLINLNTWGGTRLDSLMEFIKSQRDQVDIFCFQEIYKSPKKTITPSGYRSNLLTELSDALPDFDFHYSPQFHGRDFHAVVDYPLSQGLATFWKKTLVPKEKGEIFVFNSENEIIPIQGTNNILPPRNFQFIIFEKFLVINIHGYWEPAPKYDTPQRLRQSQMILDFVKKYNVPKIVAGDFNLGSNTQSVFMFEENGFRNLVRQFSAPTTRSAFYDIRWRAHDKFADYIFVSNDVEVNDFKVMEDEVSDHLPLCLEFEV